LENKSLIIVAALLVVAVLLVPMLLTKSQQQPAPPPPAASAPAPVPVPAPPPETSPARPVVSPDMLDKLLYGMTYDQVQEVVGAEADETETQYAKDKTGYTGPTLTVWKTWVNPDGSKLRVGFVENKLEQKEFKRRERDRDTEERPR